MTPQGKIQGSGGWTGCRTASQAPAGPLPWYVGVVESCSPRSRPVVSLRRSFPSAAFISSPFGDSARSSPGEMAKARLSHEQSCLCQSLSLLHRHKLHLLLRQMDPSMNPGITRKAKEDVQTVPGWEPFTMPELRRSDSYTSRLLPLEAIKQTEVILEHISLPILDLWLLPQHHGSPVLNRGCCCSNLSCCGSAVSDCHCHSYHNNAWGYVSTSYVHCLHFETTCKLVGSWASLRKPQLCTKVSLSESPLGQHLFTSNT